LATRYAHSPEDIVAELRASSFKGKTRFENALANLFNLMGFVATRRGAKGDEDVLIIGPTGESSTRFIVEAKGSRKAVANDDAEVGVAAGHRKQAEASLALIVAREFAGFEQQEQAALLRDLHGVEGVAIADVETLVELYRAVDRFSYPLDVVVPFLAKVESPADKRASLTSLTDPLARVDFRAVLDLIWREQQTQAALGDLVSYRPIWQSHYRTTDLSLDEFTQKLSALEALSGGLVVVDASAREVTLRQAPEHIARFVDQQLGGDSS
jgi:hypothetical protein